MEKTFNSIPFCDLNISVWEKLYYKLVNKTFFYHPVFIKNLLNTGLYPDNLQIIEGRTQGEVTTLLLGYPYVKRKVLHVFRIWSFRGFDHNCILCENCNENLIALKEYLKRYDLIEFKMLSEAFYQQLNPIINKNKIFLSKITKCPYLDIPSNESLFWANFKSKVRYNLKRELKNAQNYGFSFNFINKDKRELVFKRMIELHNSRFQSVGKESRFTTKIPQTFHQNLINESSDQFEVVMIAASKNNELHGVLYGFLIHDTFYFFNSGINPEFNRYSLGKMLILQMILYGIDNKIKRFDFLRGNEEYKKFWTKTFDNNYSGIGSFSCKGKLYLLLVRMYSFFKRNTVWIKNNSL